MMDPVRHRPADQPLYPTRFLALFVCFTNFLPLYSFQLSKGTACQGTQQIDSGIDAAKRQISRAPCQTPFVLHERTQIPVKRTRYGKERTTQNTVGRVATLTGLQ